MILIDILTSADICLKVYLSLGSQGIISTILISFKLNISFHQQTWQLEFVVRFDMAVISRNMN